MYHQVGSYDTEAPRRRGTAKVEATTPMHRFVRCILPRSGIYDTDAASAGCTGQVVDLRHRATGRRRGNHPRSGSTTPSTEAPRYQPKSWNLRHRGTEGAEVPAKVGMLRHARHERRGTAMSDLRTPEAASYATKVWNSTTPRQPRLPRYHGQRSGIYDTAANRGAEEPPRSGMYDTEAPRSPRVPQKAKVGNPERHRVTEAGRGNH
jgi:hypothetical protein